MSGPSGQAVGKKLPTLDPAGIPRHMGAVIN